MRTRAIEDDILTIEQCRELIALCQALSVLGYRDHVTSATIHDVATSLPELLVPLVHARYQVLQAVEQELDALGELFVEFTAVMAWHAGSSLGWHADDNREYLTQRHASAVVYLNAPTTTASMLADGGVEADEEAEGFTGGDFCFQDPPLRVTPAPGRMVCFDARQVHMVEPVCPARQGVASGIAYDNRGNGGHNKDINSQSGLSEPAATSAAAAAGEAADAAAGAVASKAGGDSQAGSPPCADGVLGLQAARYTLVMWFTRDAGHREDTLVLSRILCLRLPRPPPLPHTMYLVQQRGSSKGTADLRVLRMAMLGLSAEPLPSGGQPEQPLKGQHLDGKAAECDGGDVSKIQGSGETPCSSSSLERCARPAKRVRAHNTQGGALQHSSTDVSGLQGQGSEMMQAFKADTCITGPWAVWVNASTRAQAAQAGTASSSAAANDCNQQLAEHSGAAAGVEVHVDAAGSVRLRFSSLEDAAFAVFDMLRLAGGSLRNFQQALQQVDSAMALLRAHLQHAETLRAQLKECMPIWQFAGGLVRPEDVGM